jgi:hypothetical protein
MPLLGTAALAMWWDIAPAMRDEFEDWHSHEHFPERLAIPGFLRATRWTGTTGDAMFVMYEVATHDTLASADYLARLNAPSPWSTKMMPHHRNMVRSQCHVVRSHGGAVARHALTLRFSAGADGDAQASFEFLDRKVVTRGAAHPGLVGMHLLRHHKPAIPQTTEQSLRGGADEAADHALVACAYDLAALEALAASLPMNSMAAGALLGFYSLAHSATPRDAEPGLR